MVSRAASHAGSWYSASRETLASQLDAWLARVPDRIPGIGQLPPAGARIIIAPYVFSPSLLLLPGPKKTALKAHSLITSAFNN
jgi:predicted class III extradiol MEMO1 family dioxygenase